MHKISLFMKWISNILLFCSLLVLLACEQGRDSIMSVTNEKIDTIGFLYTLSPYRWYKIAGNISIDSVDTYKNEKSLRLKSIEGDGVKRILVSYLYDFNKIDGNSIVVEGKYKVKKASDAKLSLRIV